MWHDIAELILWVWRRLVIPNEIDVANGDIVYYATYQTRCHKEHHKKLRLSENCSLLARRHPLNDS